MEPCDGIPFKGIRMGSTSYPKDAQTLNLLVVTADKRMYMEKKTKTKNATDISEPDTV